MSKCDLIKCDNEASKGVYCSKHASSGAPHIFCKTDGCKNIIKESDYCLVCGLKRGGRHDVPKGRKLNEADERILNAIITLKKVVIDEIHKMETSDLNMTQVLNDDIGIIKHIWTKTKGSI